MDISGLFAQVLNGLQYGLLLFLISSGLTLIFGVMGVINLAHGSLFMIGAYAAFAIARPTGALWLALPAAWSAACSSARCWKGCCSAASTTGSTSTRCC